MLKINPEKSRGKYGKLNIFKLDDFGLYQVRSFLESLPSSLLNKGDTNTIFLNNGWYRSATRCINDFLEDTLNQICHTHLMDGICTSLEATHEETLQYEVSSWVASSIPNIYLSG